MAQLPPEQQDALIRHLQLLREAQIHEQVKEEPSPRREDWYDDKR